MACRPRAPTTPPTYSVKKRIGTFRLLDDGTLEGEARLEYTGHWGELLRDQEDQETAATREKNFREFVTKRLPGAELSEVRIENIADPSQPYTNTYKIRLTGYAQRAGNRLILQPAIFQKGGTQTFAAPQRKTRLHFRSRGASRTSSPSSYPPATRPRNRALATPSTSARRSTSRSSSLPVRN